MITAAPYTAADRDEWNAINAAARNGHFFFDRGYIEYHADRFADASLVFRDDDGVLALLPANRSGDTIVTHGGLTFGGLVLADRARAAKVLLLLDVLLAEVRRQDARKLVYKPIPWIYHRRPAQDDLYALFRHGARLIRRDVTTAIDCLNPGVPSKRRERGARKARQAGVAFGVSDDWAGYWVILSTVLEERHGVPPTHTAEEIASLAQRFPGEIKLFTATADGEIIAGVVIFEAPMVAHAQYIASNSRGRELGALDGLFAFLIERFASGKRYFNFGISTSDHGTVLNEGLIAQKEEFGGNSVVHDFYELDA